MRTVNLADLKAKLSAHIQLVRDGEGVLVCDRNKPVARIIPDEAPAGEVFLANNEKLREAAVFSGFDASRI